MNIDTVRGCIYNCAFCTTVKMWGHKIRRKSPQRIIAEFEVAKRLNVDFVFLSDDDTAIDETHLRNLCNLLISSKLDIPWGTTIGSCSVKEDSTYDLMARSGCVKVNICIESANPRILKAYRKPYSIEDNRKTCDNLIKRGILVHNHGIIGFPDETLGETLNTYFYLIKTSPLWHVSILEPRPGTDYWQGWPGQGNIAQYKLFGKANVMLSKKKISNYFIYRIFALYYFLNPFRVKKALFHKIRGVRYSYWIQYYVAYRVLKENFCSFFRKSDK
jgi:anaerobic magnesium-protoporphyrin IX monomethyl ester cyclase